MKEAIKCVIQLKISYNRNSYSILNSGNTGTTTAPQPSFKYEELSK